MKSLSCRYGLKASLVALALHSSGAIRTSLAQDAKGSPATDSTPPFHYAGLISNERGQPVQGVEVTATHRIPDGIGYGNIAIAESDGWGRFLIRCTTALSGLKRSEIGNDSIRLEFKHPKYLIIQLDDLQRQSQKQLANLQVVLQEGRTISGQIVDSEGRPVLGALVEVTFKTHLDRNRGTVSDVHGQFEMKGLLDESATLEVLSDGLDTPPLTGNKAIERTVGNIGTLTLQPAQIPKGTVIHEVFGLKLVDVNSTLKATFHLWDSTGVMVLDPGAQSDRLKIGRLKRGDVFWMVGEQKVANFSEFRSRLLDAPSSNIPLGARTCRIVYTFRRPDSTGTNTQYIELTKEDIAELIADAPHH